MSAKIWYYPNPGKPVTEIDFGVPFTNRQGPYPRVRQIISESLTGEGSTTTFHGREAIQLEHRWTNRTTAGQKLRNQLTALVCHLQHGGWCVVAENPTYAFVGFLEFLPPESSGLLSCAQNICEELVGSSVSLVNRDVMLLSDPEFFRYEPHLISAHNTTTQSLTLSPSQGLTVFDYQECNYGYVRESTTHPFMRIPLELRNDEFLQHEYDNVNFFDLPLECDPVALADYKSSGLVLHGDRDAPPAQASKDGGRGSPTAQPSSGSGFFWRTR